MSPRIDALRARLPNLLIAGVPKAATTTIANALATSADVDLGATKEPGYLTNSSYDDRQRLGLYDRHFSKADHRYRLDATPWSIYRPEGIQWLLDTHPGGRLPVIVMLRRPWSRVESMYLDQVRRGRERRTFTEAVARGGDTLAVDYVQTSLYADRLQWMIADDRVDLRVGFFDHVTDDGMGERLRSVLAAWLDIEVGALTVANSRSSGVGRITPVVDRLTHLGSSLPASFRARVRPTYGRFVRAAIGVTARRESSAPTAHCTDDSLRHEISNRFEMDRRQLAQILEYGPVLLPELPSWVTSEA